MNSLNSGFAQSRSWQDDPSNFPPGGGAAEEQARVTDDAALLQEVLGEVMNLLVEEEEAERRTGTHGMQGIPTFSPRSLGQTPSFPHNNFMDASGFMESPAFVSPSPMGPGSSDGEPRPTVSALRWGRLIHGLRIKEVRGIGLQGTCLLATEKSDQLTFAEEQMIVYILLRDPAWTMIFPRLAQRVSELMASRLRVSLGTGSHEAPQAGGATQMF